MAKAYKKRSLGRGLSSILNDDENNILDQKKNKLFNEIESEITGKIVKILVDDSSPVEFDQPLFLVDPS